MADTASATRAKEPLNWFVKRWLKLVNYLTADLFGGPRPLKLSTVINAQKGGTLIFCLGLMHHYNNWNNAAWAYAALHGSYGLCWLLKERVFPDPKWQVKVTIPSAIVAWAAVLGPYWLAPYLLISSGAERPPWVIGATTISYALGLVTMMGADGQKYFVLKQRKGLIADGFFARVRHPNYLGEMLIYGSFAVLSGQPLSMIPLAVVWGGLFAPYILQKEHSMSRYDVWPQYRRRTGLLLPKLF